MYITLNSLTDYNAGRLIWKTFELDNMDQDEYFAAVADWLESITKRRGDDEIREEWNVADIEDIPHHMVNDYDLSAEFWEFKEAMDNSHLPQDVFAAAAGAGINLDEVEDRYQGQWATDREFAECFFDDVYLHDVPDFMQYYIDYDAFTRDLMVDYTEFDGHYFLNC